MSEIISNRRPGPEDGDPNSLVLARGTGRMSGNWVSKYWFMTEGEWSHTPDWKPRDLDPAMEAAIKTIDRHATSRLNDRLFLYKIAGVALEAAVNAIMPPNEAIEMPGHVIHSRLRDIARKLINCGTMPASRTGAVDD